MDCHALVGGTGLDLGEDSREGAIHAQPSGSGDPHILRVHIISFSKPWGLWIEQTFLSYLQDRRESLDDETLGFL